MGTLAEALNNLSASRGGPPCAVDVILSKLDDEDRATLLESLANRDIPSTKIATALSENGYPIHSANIARHRRSGASGCRCEK